MRQRSFANTRNSRDGIDVADYLRLRTGINQAMAKFIKGQSGNPGGRPKAVAKVRELAQAETKANIRALAAIRDDISAPHAARIAAVRELHDRAFGKPTQPFAGDGRTEAVRFIIDGLAASHDAG